MNRSSFFIPIILFLMALAGQAQIRISEMNISQIKQKSIRNFIKNQIDSGLVYFEDFQSSVNAQTDTNKFDSNIHRFHLRQTPATTWNAYLTAHPAKVWNGKIVSFGFIYSPVNKLVIFPDDKYPGLETGQIFFIEMRVFWGLAKFPVCFMVTKIDKNQHSITFSYVSSGTSKGSQTISLVDDGKGETTTIHSSIHKTENVLRDKTLYPIYHLKAIKEVHQNIRNMLKMYQNRVCAF